MSTHRLPNWLGGHEVHIAGTRGDGQVIAILHRPDDTLNPTEIHIDPERLVDYSASTTDAAHLSRLLFDARESLEMWADVVEARTSRADEYTRGLVARIDSYRAERGWSPHGFGGES